MWGGMREMRLYFCNWLEITKFTDFMVSIWRVYGCVLVAQSCPTLCDSIDCSPSGYSVHGILQARILEWVGTPFPRGSSPGWSPTQGSNPGLPHCGQILYCLSHWSAQSRSYKTQGWMTHKLGSIFLGKYQQLQIFRWYHFNGRKWRRSTYLPPEESVCKSRSNS